MTTAIDLDAFAGELHRSAQRLAATAGRWGGTGAGRSSGLLLALSVLQRHREEAERAARGAL